jgi:hypothetical protein
MRSTNTVMAKRGLVACVAVAILVAAPFAVPSSAYAKFTTVGPETTKCLPPVQGKKQPICACKDKACVD